MDVEVTRNDGEQRYEATVEGQLAGFAEFRVHGDVVAFPHTVVHPRYEGQGVAGRIARFGLDDVVASGRRIRAECSYIVHFVDTHPEYAEHLAD